MVLYKSVYCYYYYWKISNNYAVRRPKLLGVNSPTWPVHQRQHPSKDHSLHTTTSVSIDGRRLLRRQRWKERHNESPAQWQDARTSCSCSSGGTCHSIVYIINHCFLQIMPHQWQVLTDTNGPHDAKHHTQSSPCCAQSWTRCVINRRQSTVNNYRHAVVKLFLVQRLEKSCRGNCAYFWGYSNLIFVWYLLPSFRGFCPLD